MHMHKKLNQGGNIYLLSGNKCSFHFQILNIIWKNSDLIHTSTHWMYLTMLT